MPLLDYERFDFIKLLVKNRKKITFCTRLGKAQTEEEKKQIEAEMQVLFTTQLSYKFIVYSCFIGWRRGRKDIGGFKVCRQIERQNWNSGSEEGDQDNKDQDGSYWHQRNGWKQDGKRCFRFRISCFCTGMRCEFFYFIPYLIWCEGRTLNEQQTMQVARRIYAKTEERIRRNISARPQASSFPTKRKTHSNSRAAKVGTGRIFWYVLLVFRFKKR